MSYITGAASLVEPGLDVLFVYNIRCPSGNRYLAGDASPHSPQTYIQAYCIDAYLSLLEEQQAQHTQRLPKKVRRVVSMYFGNVTHWKTGRREQRKKR